MDVVDRDGERRHDPTGLPDEARSRRVQDVRAGEVRPNPLGLRVPAQLGERGELVVGEPQGHRPTLLPAIGSRQAASRADAGSTVGAMTVADDDTGVGSSATGHRLPPLRVILLVALGVLALLWVAPTIAGWVSAIDLSEVDHLYAIIAGFVTLDAVVPIFPSESLLTTASNLAAQDGSTISLWRLIAAGTIGAIVGDTLLYWLSRGVGRRLRRGPGRAGATQREGGPLDGGHEPDGADVDRLRPLRARAAVRDRGDDGADPVPVSGDSSSGMRSAVSSGPRTRASSATSWHR